MVEIGARGDHGRGADGLAGDEEERCEEEADRAETLREEGV